MHDVACEFARAAVRSKDAQKQLARTKLNSLTKCLETEKCFFLQVCTYFRKHYTQSSKGDSQMNVLNLLAIF